jgi:release factor glutamine methyltransferase
VNLSAALAAAAQSLQSWSDSARLDAQTLLAQRLDKPRAWLLAHPEAELTPAQAAQLQSDLARLAGGEPLPYVLGEWEFFGLRFAVSPAVLIPRPETELLVEQALDWLRARPAASRCRAADVGCGSGCIAVSLARQAPALEILAIDPSLPRRWRWPKATPAAGR